MNEPEAEVQLNVRIKWSLNAVLDRHCRHTKETKASVIERLLVKEFAIEQPLKRIDEESAVDKSARMDKQEKFDKLFNVIIPLMNGLEWDWNRADTDMYGAQRLAILFRANKLDPYDELLALIELGVSDEVIASIPVEANVVYGQVITILRTFNRIMTNLKRMGDVEALYTAK